MERLLVEIIDQHRQQRLPLFGATPVSNSGDKAFHAFRL
jgi:hypothetical protein